VPMRLHKNPNLFYSYIHSSCVTVLFNLTNRNNHLNNGGNKSGRPSINLYEKKNKSF